MGIGPLYRHFRTREALAEAVYHEEVATLCNRARELQATLVAAAVKAGAIRDDVGAGAVMMALHGIGAAHDRPDWRAEADDVITLVLAGLRRSWTHPPASSSDIACPVPAIGGEAAGSG